MTSTELILSSSLTLPNGQQIRTLPELLNAINSLPEEEREGTWLDLNDKAYELLQKQDAFAEALFDADCDAGYYNDRDERFRTIREAQKRTVTAEQKRITILNMLRKLLPSHIQELESPEVSNKFLEQVTKRETFILKRNSSERRINNISIP